MLETLLYNIRNFSKTQILQFNKLIDLFTEWNKKINLSSFKDRDSIIIKNLIDSLLILKHYDFNQTKNIIDIGTGGGFPGIPLSIASPKTRITLFDSIAKKINACNDISNKLGLSNIDTISGRAETLGHNDNLREQYDISIARAVAPLGTLLEYMSPFVRKDGTLIIYKGKNYINELNTSKNAIKLLNLKLEKVSKDTLPNNIGARYFLFFKKTNKLSKKYPRKPGTPKNHPL